MSRRTVLMIRLAQHLLGMLAVMFGVGALLGWPGVVIVMGLWFAVGTMFDIVMDQLKR